MTRRGAIRQTVLFAMGMALGKMDVVKAQGGQLTVNLDQWHEIVFTYRGKTVRVPVSEVFKSLQEGPTT